MEIKILNKSQNLLPEYKTLGSAGADIRANLDKYGIVIAPRERRVIPTGLFIELPIGYEAQIRPRSGLALEQGITVLNTPGTIDSDYRKEIKVILVNHGRTNFKISNGDRIAQMVIAAYEKAIWLPVSELDEEETTRKGGFGSTGID